MTDLGYKNAGDGFRHPVKKPQGGKLAEHQQAFNKVIRGIHGVAERANALLTYHGCAKRGQGVPQAHPGHAHCYQLASPPLGRLNPPAAPSRP